MSKIQDQINDIKKDVNDILVKDATTNEKLSNIESTLIIINEKFEKYTTIEKFTPVQLITYGAVGAILLMFSGALGMYVFKGDTSNITNISPILHQLSTTIPQQNP